MDNFQLPFCMKCPFCLNPIADSNTGEILCPNCQAEFEIDDRGECIFVNPDNFRLSINGIVCKTWGLVQEEGRDRCGYCGAELYVTMQ